MKKLMVLACLCGAVFVLSGCATMPADTGPRIERALDRAEFALAAAEMALAMWDAQAQDHPEADRWPEERAKLAEAVKEARAVVAMLKGLTE